MCRFLNNDKQNLVISNQLLKSGTSIGANIEEASAAQSKKDFIAKVYISLKEARETNYWLRLIVESEILPEQKVINLLNESTELCKILAQSILTSKKSDN